MKKPAWYLEYFKDGEKVSTGFERLHWSDLMLLFYIKKRDGKMDAVNVWEYNKQGTEKTLIREKMEQF